MVRKSLIQEFEKTAQSHASEIAVIEEDKSISFSELSDVSKKIACKLMAMGVRQSAIVACYLPKSINCVSVNLAVSYSCAAYMNLDLKAPIARVKAVIENVSPSLIVTDKRNYEACKLASSGLVEVWIIEDFDLSFPIDQDALNQRMSKLIDTDLYCVINTSGSTGVPKSVALGHKSFLDFCDWAMSEFDKNKFKRIGSLSPAIFDIYSFELALLCRIGSSLVIIPETLSAFPVKIIEKLNQHKVTFIFWVPTIMVNIANLDLLKNGALEALELCWFAGEVFPTKQFNYWRKRIPNVDYVNLYGPIEITLDCTFYKIRRELSDDEPIPIGVPCDNTGLLILNEDNIECGVMEEGELCVRGSSLAHGYYNSPEKTDASFVQNPLQTHYRELIYRTGDIVHTNKLGEIIYKGRRDTLIKHSGYRIELGEIEHVAISNKIVKNCCATYSNADKKIVLYYEHGSILSEKDIINSLMSFLPKYMVPVKYVVVEALAMNSNGKIDRNFYKTLSNG